MCTPHSPHHQAQEGKPRVQGLLGTLHIRTLPVPQTDNLELLLFETQLSAYVIAITIHVSN